jgi:hypothetical protein
MSIRIEIDDVSGLTRFELSKLSNYFLDILKKTQLSEDSETTGKGIGRGNKRTEYLIPDNTRQDEITESFVDDEDEVFTAPVSVMLDDKLDSESLPWDERIHATTHTKTKTGTWKVMRGADPVFVREIKEKLRATMNLPSVPAASSIISAPVVPPPPSSLMNPGAAEFGLLVGKITKAQKNKQITAVQVLAVLNSLGLESIVALSTRPDLVPSVETMIDGLLEEEDE